MAFDYSRLSWSDFELLVADIIEEREKISLEVFSEGKDDGIDARFSRTKGINDIIVQAKHYSDASSLIGVLKKEVLKIPKLNPKRYILVTSVKLSKTQIDTVFKLFDPYIKNTSDIIHGRKLDLILGKNEELLRRHMKLWLDSGAILKHIFQSGAIQKAEQVRDDIERKIRVYVQNKNFDAVLDILEKSNYCLISGAPGIGKSTLAEMVIYFFIKEGYDLVKLSSSIDEGFALLESNNKKQIFYFDDFLGSNFLEDGIGAKNEDDNIIRFIDRIGTLKNKKFILTTREYILNQAFQKYSKFSENGLDVRKFTVRVDQYELIDKARILYNHLFFSDIPVSLKLEISDKGLYKELIGNDWINNPKHAIFNGGFNPKIIHFYLKNNSVSDNPAMSGKDIINGISEALRNPKTLYEGIFHHQITDSSRTILFALYSFGNQSTYDDVQTMWRSLRKIERQPESERDFITSLKELEGTFIKTTKNPLPSGKIITYIDFTDPFVKDFLAKIVFSQKITLNSILGSSFLWRQIQFLYSGFNKQDTEVLILTRGFFSDSEALSLIKEKLVSITGLPTVGERLLWTSNNLPLLNDYIIEIAPQYIDSLYWEISIPLAIKIDGFIEFDHSGFIENCIDIIQGTLDDPRVDADEIAESFQRLSSEITFSLISEYFERHGKDISNISLLVQTVLSQYDSTISEVESDLRNNSASDKYETDYLSGIIERSEILGDFIGDNSTFDYAMDISRRLEEIREQYDDDSWKEHRDNTSTKSSLPNSLDEVDVIFGAGFC